MRRCDTAGCFGKTRLRVKGIESPEVKHLGVGIENCESGVSPFSSTEKKMETDVHRLLEGV